MISSARVLVGDCMELMRSLPDQSVNCCVTSPPYFGLRDYGMEGQIGLEETPEAYVQRMVEVFREVKRVLRDDGTLWLNIGDSYARTGGTDRKVSDTAKVGSTRNTLKQMSDRTTRAADMGLKEKDLIGIPWMLAFALRTDGWYLRQDIIWHKPNPMPESVRDRCTKSHEYVFLLSKGPRYFFDTEAMRENAVKGAAGSKFNKGKTAEHQLGRSSESDRADDGKRNRRSVWSVSTKPYKGAHFATFPPDLIEPCILSGCPAGGTVLDPFGGSGTTAGVAVAHGRGAVLCELNPEYAALVPDRIKQINNFKELDMATIYLTPYNPDTLQATGPSQPSGFDSIQQVRDIMGPPEGEGVRCITYASAGLCYSEMVIAL